MGTSIFLIAIGAILDFAVKVRTNGFNLNTIGLILMIVGVIGLVASLVFWSSWGGFSGGRRTTTVRADGRGADGLSRAGYQRRVVERDPTIVEHIEEERF